MKANYSLGVLLVVGLGLNWLPANVSATELPPLPACGKSPEARALTVAEAVDLALCRHPLTREYWAQARGQAAQLGISEAAWRPRLDARGSWQERRSGGIDSELRSAELSLSWLVYDFGLRAANEENARQLLAAALASRDATLQGVFLAAVQAYYNTQATQAAQAAALLAEKAASRSLEAAEARYRAGSATPADRLLAQTARSQATLARIRSEGEARTARGTLANALGFSASQPLMLAPLAALPPMADFSADVERLIDEAQRRRPDLLAAQAQVQAAEAAVAAARAQGRPALSLGAGPQWQSLAGRETQVSSLGLTLSVPLFTGFEHTWRVRQAEAQRDLRQAQQERQSNQVALDVWKAWHGLQTATQAWQASGDLLASAEQSARVALGRYQAGVGTVLDLLTAQAAEASARQQRIQSELDWNVQRASLAQALGRLEPGWLATAAGEQGW
ncbi:TolC family protein [Dechloromonas sp. ZY10]|uniref:TolC family protein n=1 Tax=Dechloromonas aquae TaxID=2664436 RepID=UPI00352956B4